MVGFVCSASYSPGHTGEPDVTAQSGCRSCGYGGLLEDHPADSVALHGDEVQRAASSVTRGFTRPQQKVLGRMLS